MSEDFFDENMGYEPEIDFEDKENVKVVIRNGSPESINNIKAIR